MFSGDTLLQYHKQIYSWFPLDEGMKVVLCQKSDYWSRESASSSISVRWMSRWCVSGRCCLDGNPLILWINTVCKLFLSRILWAVFIKASNSWPATCFTSSDSDSDQFSLLCVKLNNRMSGWCSQVYILSLTFVSQGFRRRIPSFYWLKYLTGCTLGRKNIFKCFFCQTKSLKLKLDSLFPIKWQRTASILKLKMINQLSNWAINSLCISF